MRYVFSFPFAYSLFHSLLLKAMVTCKVKMLQRCFILHVTTTWVTVMTSKTSRKYDNMVRSTADRDRKFGVLPKGRVKRSRSLWIWSPFALGRSRRPGCAADQNCWLRSTKILSRWSVSVEQSVTGNKDDITDPLAVLRSAENWNVLTQLLRVSAAQSSSELVRYFYRTRSERAFGSKNKERVQKAFVSF